VVAVVTQLRNAAPQKRKALGQWSATIAEVGAIRPKNAAVAGNATIAMAWVTPCMSALLLQIQMPRERRERARARVRARPPTWQPSNASIAAEKVTHRRIAPVERSAMLAMALDMFSGNAQIMRSSGHRNGQLTMAMIQIPRERAKEKEAKEKEAKETEAKEKAAKETEAKGTTVGAGEQSARLYKV